MTGNIFYCTSLSKIGSGNITYGDNAKCKISGEGIIDKSSLHNDNVIYTKGLKHNTLSISQLCDKCYKVIL